MIPRTDGASRGQRTKHIQGEGPNWILIAGGALLSTLSIRLGYKLKQTFDSRQQQANANNALKGNGTHSGRRRSPARHLQTNMYSFTQDNGSCFNCVSVPAPEFGKENGVLWASSPDRLEVPPKPFHHSNCSDSPCVSESGSDIFSKREVICKLRQQLKRRDDMILEMQDQIVELQNSLNAQLEHSTHLQSQLDAANKDLFDSEREVQRLRKAIADHCVGHVGTNDKPLTHAIWPTEARNGLANGYIDGENNHDNLEKGRGDGGKIEMLRKEVGELKEVIDGKDYLLQSYKEQKTELSMKVKELQQRLDSQLPNIL
ncbi:hypothetical protein KPL70_012335 [Citrus sinensis]|nr:hypothetical protein KPL70_012335 [Citrus sinensis]